MKEGAVLEHDRDNSSRCSSSCGWRCDRRRSSLRCSSASWSGSSITAALGLMMVGALNPISVAFAVLFVGIGVDFGIQFSVRYRAERHEIDDLRDGAGSTPASNVGVPLTLAAAATAAGFFSFLPTALSRIFRARVDRRRRHDGRLINQHHAPAGFAEGPQSARRNGTARLSRRWRRSTGLSSAIAFRSSPGQL